MTRFNYPTRLPSNSQVSIEQFPSNLITDKRNYYTEITFSKYTPPFQDNVVGLLVGTAGSFLGDSLETVGAITGAITGSFDLYSGADAGVYRPVPDGTVYRLPIPRKLNENQVLSWQERSLTDLVTNLAVSAAYATGRVDYRAATAIERAISAVNGPLTAFTGVKLNPYLFLYFDRPTFKRYSFTWTLAARNLQESKEIRKIVTRLKERSLPSVNTLTMRYPDVLNIKFLPNEVFGMMKMKPCVIESVNVDYTPAGPSFFQNSGSEISADDGAPTLISLTIQVKEIELWSQNDYTGVEFTDEELNSNAIDDFMESFDIGDTIGPPPAA